MKLDARSVIWAENHAELGSDKIWRCKETKVQMRVYSQWRTITCMIMKTGLEVKKVGTVYCPKCMPKPEFPQYGERISEEQVLDHPDK